MESISPLEIKLLQKSHTLFVAFNNGVSFTYTCAYLRAFSPSAEMRAHNQQKENEKLMNEDVNIIGIDPVGNYAIKLIFDDGHQTGIYTWPYLYELGLKLKENN